MQRLVEDLISLSRIEAEKFRLPDQAVDLAQLVEDTREELAEAAGEGWCPVGVNGISLIQEYAPRRDGKITRVETLNGKYLYAIDIESPGDAFDLCPADACLVRPGAPTLTMTRVTPPDEIIAAAELIAAEGRLEIGSVEYLIDDRDGSALFYDINALSNFVARPMEVLGFEPHDVLVDWLMAIVAEEAAKVAVNGKAAA